MYKSFLKRFFDLLVSFIVLVILLPILLLIFLLLFFTNGGSPFFIQLRPGKNTQVFKIIKFKTMNEKKDFYGNLLPDAQRITFIGKLVRKTSFDEIPQLINVLKGEMSLIGPRPLLVQYLPLYNKQQAIRHEVLPGITGWAQVNGRNAMKFSKRFEYDVWYVNNLNFILDLKILFMTLKKIMTSDGVINGQEIQDVDDLNFNNR